MRLAADLLPKRNPEGLNCEGEGSCLEYTEEEGSVREAISRSGGKTLLVYDGNDCEFTAAASSPRAISLVFDGDCLPLFSMPDGVSRVLASGGAELMRAARYFSEIRSVPCTLYPVSASLEGILEQRGFVCIGGEPASVPLKGAEAIVCRKTALEGSLAEGYARCLLARLAALEARALAKFSQRGDEEYIAEFPALAEEEDIVKCNFLQREKERLGFPAGEGVCLASLLRERGEKFPNFRAYLQLSALYAAFFEKGKPRRYFTPNYKQRAEEAGGAVFSVPTPEDYVRRAMTLERIRAPFAREAAAISDEREERTKIISRLAGEPVQKKAGDLKALKLLPERAPGGLTEVIRDFGLMEWEL